MRLEYVFTSLLAAVVAALMTNLLVSDYAPQGYGQLERYADRLQVNIAELEATRDGLVAEAELYQRNREAVAVEARTLGYVAPDQRVIRVDAPLRDRRQSPGSLLSAPSQRRDRRPITRAIAVAVFLIATALQLLASQRPPAAKRYRSSEMRRASR